MTLLVLAGCGALPWSRDGARTPQAASTPPAETTAPPEPAVTVPDEPESESTPEPTEEKQPEAAVSEFSGPATAEGFRVGEGSVAFPAQVTAAQQETPAIARLRATAEQRGSAYAWRQVADACVEARLYQQAADSYRREAELRRREGDPNAAAVEEGKARRWETEALLFRETPVSLSGTGSARFEPADGCYIGAIVERDPRVGGDHSRFNELTGKQHSIFLDYRSYGVPFAEGWAQSLSSAGAAAQIAFEPNGGLDSVRDDQYLRSFARSASAAGIPIFLRFAGEFNGDWTRYGGDPAKYIEKWRLVHRVMREEAPNVAMVWTPNVIPEEKIPAYYPGDDFVDWVGVNCYTVHHHNNSQEHPAEHENPADMLRWIYDRYAERKPIMIGEYAATHYCKADGKMLPQFAADKLRTLYASLPRLYPRVKAVHWYDIDNTSHRVRAGRDTNNFSLTDDETVLSAYRSAVRSPYFLPRVPKEDESLDTLRCERLKAGDLLSGTVRLSAWVKTWDEHPVVLYRLDGKPQAALIGLPYSLEWDTTRVSNGKHTLQVTVLAEGRMVRQEKVELRVLNAKPGPQNAAGAAARIKE
ncbi:MAG: hypothetical protein K0Q72_1896 [Armatimonadetes bacterium]|nr:hypothetical protein [Armatimonadota bacterium]